jgi:hypothetical protein
MRHHVATGHRDELVFDASECAADQREQYDGFGNGSCQTAKCRFACDFARCNKMPFSNAVLQFVGFNASCRPPSRRAVWEVRDENPRLALRPQ